MSTGVPAGRGVVVTGASSGIGAACALYLDKLGWRVFACVLPGEDGGALRREASERLRLVELEVTDPTAIAAAADTVAAAAGAAGLAGLVNNAGISVTGPLEFLPIPALRQQLEVNVLGQIAVTQAFLPLLRRGHGRIVMMGSPLDAFPLPLTGPTRPPRTPFRP